MRLGKLLAASGLAFLAGPFCLSALAQSYVDVEAERAAAKSSTETAPTTSGSTPPTSQPSSTTTRSYGLGTAPAAADPYASQPGSSVSGSSLPPTTGISPVTTTTTAAPASTVATPRPADPGAANLLYQVQQLQQEVMRLNGLVEEQAFEIRTLKQQSLERYVDLDRRVSALSGGAAAGATAAGSAAGTGAGGLAVGSGATAGTGGGSAQPGEADAYRAAYALVRSQQFDQAVTAFNQFLDDYPAGKFAPNAHYWLGELYLVITPPDPESARQSFMLLVDQYPENSKVPDALYKLGRVQFMKGNRDRSREFLDRVISEHGDSSAAKLAQEFIDQNF